MTKGIEIHDVTVGNGDEALRGKTIVANVRMFLHHGTEVTGTFTGAPKIKIDLGKRECIAGLRRGIEGMRVGGVRTLVISPHLAFGANGVPGSIPPNAILRCEVELLEVREPGVRKPEDYPQGKHLHVFHPGEAARNLPRWQFGLCENGSCGVHINFPIPGMTWRYTRRKGASWQLEQTEAASVFQSAVELPNQSPEDCLPHEELWADATEPANSITRDRKTNTRCISISLYERGQSICNYAVPENSRILIDSKLFEVVNRLLEPYLLPITDT